MEPPATVRRGEKERTMHLSAKTPATGSEKCTSASAVWPGSRRSRS